MKIFRLLIPLFSLVAFSMSADNRIALEKKFSFPSALQEQEDIICFGASHFFLSPGGEIFIANSKAHEIISFGSDGKHICRFGRKGQGPGDFNNPTFVLLKNNKLVILDNNNFRIQICDVNGEHVRNLKIAKTYISFALLNQKGYLGCPLVSRTQEHLIEVLDLEGQLRNSFGQLIRNTTKNRNILNRIHLDVNRQGSIYMASEFYPVVRKYSSSGDLIWEYSINDEEVVSLGKENDRRLEKAKGGERIGYLNTFNAVKAKEDGFFLLKTMPHFEILEIDETGDIVNTYYYQHEGLYLAFDFDYVKTGGQYMFYVLQFGPENKIDVFGQR